MNNERSKTLAFVAVALATTGLAFTLSRMDDRAANQTFDDQGQTFFESFKDPLIAQSMEVIEYNPDTATVSPFQVQQKNGRWSIPSHYDYPAEAKDRLSKTAAGLIDLKKETIRSDDISDHEKLGVIDPLDTKTTSLKGRGKRVTLRKQAGGEVLADLIIGNEVRDRPGQRFVRIPSSPRTYGVNVNVDLSTRFSDWIKQDLLNLENNRIRKIVIDRHRADPAKGILVPGEVTTLTRNETTNNWLIDNQSADQKVNSSKISEITSALTGLKILGVRPKPAGLTKDLKQSNDGNFQISQQALLSLQSRGFYRTRDGALVSNQGEIQVGTDQGVVYVLRFGEVTVARGEALSAGTSDDSTEKQQEADKTKSKPENTENTKNQAGDTEGRFLFITARFDPDLVKLPATQLSESGNSLPADPFQSSDSAQTTAGFEEDVKKEQNEKKEKEQKLANEVEIKREEGRKLVKQLADRYASWYYVVSGTTFQTISVSRETLLQATESNSELPAPSQGMPALPPGFSLPGAINGR